MRFCRAARFLFTAGLLAASAAPSRPAEGQTPAATAAPKSGSAGTESASAGSRSDAPRGASAKPAAAPAKPAAHSGGKPASTAKAESNAAPEKPATAKAESSGAPEKPATAKAESRGAPEKPAPAGKPATKASSKSSAKLKKNEKPSKRAVPRKPGSEPGEPDESARRVIAGAAAGRSTRESPELRAMRDLDLALFPSSAPSPGLPWEAEGTALLDTSEPRVHASGMPPQGLRVESPAAKPARDLSWLRQLTMPDIPVRWDERVIRYLEYYKDNPHGRSMVATYIRRSGRYGAFIRRVLRENGMPEDIVWLALVESGFDPTIQSPVGAAGLWQFMPDGARIYGLTVDRWVDERLDPERATVAAARYLADLRKRFGGWELAFAAYNMGYGGLLASIRKYNTNDFWELSRLEAGMPLETALYVPKIVAMAIVAKNKAVFGCGDIDLDPAVSFDKVSVGSGISLKTVAAASGAGVTDIEGLNPQLLAGRTPPLAPGARDAKWVVRVPPGSAATAAKSIPKLLEREPKLERYLVRWGESLDDIATFRGTTRSSLQSLNDLRTGEVIRPGTVIFVPARPGIGAAAAANLIATSPAVRPVVVVPAQAFIYPNRRRVFYRVIAGDTLRDLASVLGVTPDELTRWNTLDPSAALHEGMTLQAFVPARQSLASVFVLDDKDARIMAVGSTEFFDHFEALKGRKRLEIAAREGDTFSGVAKRYGLTMGMLERINHRSRTTPIQPGDRLVVYIPSTRARSDDENGREKESPPEKLGEKPETAVASTNPAGEDAEDVKPALLKMTPEERDIGEDDAREPGEAGKPALPAAPSPPAGSSPRTSAPAH